mmetsp:Transcript_7373/g.20926  ORF Transcript_7373/g.20926 Transcript_7373/m.20926 type:complete len:224 (-) Transcript_7373:1869-2540(-)
MSASPSSSTSMTLPTCPASSSTGSCESLLKGLTTVTLSPQRKTVCTSTSRITSICSRWEIKRPRSAMTSTAPSSSRSAFTEVSIQLSEPFRRYLTCCPTSSSAGRNFKACSRKLNQCPGLMSTLMVPVSSSAAMTLHGTHFCCVGELYCKRRPSGKGAVLMKLSALRNVSCASLPRLRKAWRLKQSPRPRSAFKMSSLSSDTVMTSGLFVSGVSASSAHKRRW